MIGYDAWKTGRIKPIHSPESTQDFLITIDNVRGVRISRMFTDDFMKPLVKRGNRLMVELARRLLELLFNLNQWLDYCSPRELGGAASQQRFQRNYDIIYVPGSLQIDRPHGGSAIAGDRYQPVAGQLRQCLSHRHMPHGKASRDLVDFQPAAKGIFPAQNRVPESHVDIRSASFPHPSLRRNCA